MPSAPPRWLRSTLRRRAWQQMQGTLSRNALWVIFVGEDTASRQIPCRQWLGTALLQTLAIQTPIATWDIAITMVSVLVKMMCRQWHGTFEQLTLAMWKHNTIWVCVTLGVKV